MKRRQLLCWLFVPLLLSAQDPVPPDAPKPPKPQFFAGVVIEADGEHVKVSRSLVGRPAETHVFAVDGKTKTPKGGIKVKSRVTVRYEHWPERDLALEIQVRPANHTQKTT
jgi:hypothetical protein